MKIIELLHNDVPSLSFEVFPPKTDTAFENVRAAVEEIAKLRPDIRKGLSLANAYQKMLNEQKAAELAEAERKAAAKAQNYKNRTASPGSQRDSGGRREKSGFDDFFSQFN